MASITNAQLSIEHDHNKRLAHVRVTGSVRFSELELCQMRSCREANLFKLKCQLWGADSPDPDDFLYTIGTVYYFPDGDPTASETRTFQVTLGEGVLDEDGWFRPKDEVYARLKLYNLLTGGIIARNSNTVEHYF